MRRTRRHVVSLVFIILLAGASVASFTVFELRPRLGLDLRGGLSVVLTAVGETDTEVLEQTVEIIRQRVDAIGATEPEVSRVGGENIIVQLPDIDDPDRAREIIGRTAQLRFREVIERLPPELAQEQGWELTEDDPADEEVVFEGEEGTAWYHLGPAVVFGDQVDDAFAQFREIDGWHVQLRLRGEGARQFAEVTERLSVQGGLLAIVLDRMVESAPRVNQPILDGQAVITGDFSEREARDLGLVLRTGALPIELEEAQVRQVSATLGSASLQAGLLAGALGMILVALWVLLYYRLLGAIILVGMGLFGSIVFGIISVLGATLGFALTLAGIAGLIVSVGIAADSYIIFYERVKDELREGKTFRSAVDRGFTSAFRTNLAGNTVALAAALILYMLAIGPVRGFALMLGIAVVVDIMLLYFFTYPAVGLIARNKKLAGLRSVGMREAAQVQHPEAVGAR